MKKIKLVTLLVVFMVLPSVVCAQYALLRRLKASPDDFVGKEIILKCRFGMLSTVFLNGGSSRYSPYFSSTEYLAFSIRGSNAADDLYPTLFVKKNKGEILYTLNDYDKITIRGKITSSYSAMPWIEVYEIKKGWK